MIAVDTNILVYAHREDSAWFEAANEVVRGLAEGRGEWAVPWPCVYEFLAVVTHPRIFRPPTPLAKALDQIDAWLESPTVVLLAEAPDSWPRLRDVLKRSRVLGPPTHDARIVSLCREHGVEELWSADRDFSRFRDVRVRNPLTS
ncbi:MAG: type II toxin-antitoxin system VapC family toxin [Longimicrobiales bacterium]